jgi:tryptophan synthase beta chain
LVRAAKSGEVPAGSSVLLTMSGRGDKDAEHVMKLLAAAAETDLV